MMFCMYTALRWNGLLDGVLAPLSYHNVNALPSPPPFPSEPIPLPRGSGIQPGGDLGDYSFTLIVPTTAAGGRSSSSNIGLTGNSGNSNAGSDGDDNVPL
jgi:hypothetical protein